MEKIIAIYPEKSPTILKVNLSRQCKKEMGKNLIRNFSIKEIQMASKYRKRCSSLVTKEK